VAIHIASGSERIVPGGGAMLPAAMRMKTWTGLCIFLLTATVFAATTLDLSDFDEDAMHAIDDAKQDLESDLSGNDAKSAAANAAIVRDGLKWAESYFAKKGSVDDAIQLAQQGQEFAATIIKSAGAKDFAAASDAYDGLVRTCKRCHDAYKPPSL